MQSTDFTPTIALNVIPAIRGLTRAVLSWMVYAARFLLLSSDRHVALYLAITANRDGSAEGSSVDVLIIADASQ